MQIGKLNLAGVPSPQNRATAGAAMAVSAREEDSSDEVKLTVLSGALADPARAERVEKLRLLVAAGKYSVSARELASDLVDFHLE